MLVVTTTLTVTRPTADGDPYETGATTTVYTSIEGHVSAPSGGDRNIGGDLEVVDAVAYLPAGTVLEHSDRIVDDGTGNEYAVTWTRQRQGLGLDHVVAGLRAVKGGSNG